jgi:hypothetical protein
MRENGGGQGHLTKGPWLPVEDALLASLVAKFGARDWSAVSLAMIQHGHHRLGKQCRERYEIFVVIRLVPLEVSRTEL